MKKFLLWPLAMIGMVLLLQACKKNDYYVDGGLANPKYKGTIYDYLTEKSYYFDTIRYIVEKAGLKDMLSTDTVTFFAPTDDAIKDAMNLLNRTRYQNVEDSVYLPDIGPEVWRRFLGMYIMKGKRLAASFPRMNPDNIAAYPGINYVMLDGYILNIGLIYENYKGVEAVGARILNLTDVTYDPAVFRNNPSIRVASSDIQPVNGVIHALKQARLRVPGRGICAGCTGLFKV